MRSHSPGIWRTRIAIKEEVLRQKVHLDVKYCSFNCENVSVALTAVFLKQNMPKVKRPPINVFVPDLFGSHLVGGGDN